MAIAFDPHVERICLQSSLLFLVLRSLGLVCAVCFACAAFAQNSFQITRIPTAEGFNRVALGINNKGDVVGYRYQGEDQQAFLYSSLDKSLTEVGSFGGKTKCCVRHQRRRPGHRLESVRNSGLLYFQERYRLPLSVHSREPHLAKHLESTIVER
jgi:probable HAF family extracellular repeat protein